MFKELKVGRIMSVGQYDAANSAPIPLTQLAAGGGFKSVPLGRTPWPSQDDLKGLFDEAEKEGYAIGLKKAQEKVEGERKRDAMAVRHLLEGLTQPYEDINEQLLGELTTLALKAGAILARKQLTTDPDALQTVIKDALGNLPKPDSPAELSLHPDDVSLVTDQLKIDAPQLTIVPEPTLKRGDCVLTSGASVVDGRLECQLEQLIDAAMSAP
ncbi:MAG: FliH/SctL family protein [Lysobacterales bacterium]